MESKQDQELYEKILESAQKIEIPKELEVDAVKEQLKKKKKPQTRRKKWELAAAAMVVVVLGVTGVQQLGTQTSDGQTASSESSKKQTSSEDDTAFVRKETVGEYHLAKSYEEYLAAFRSTGSDYELSEKTEWITGGQMMEGAATEDTADAETKYTMLADQSQSDSKKQAYSQTNTQVEGIDESDYVKNDGQFLYVKQDQKLHIIDIRGTKMKELTAFDPMLEENSEIREIYIGDNRLYLIVQEWDDTLRQPGDEYAKCAVGDVLYFHENTKTVLMTYDLSDLDQIGRIGKIEQDGSYVDSRKKGDEIYLLSQKGTNAMPYMEKDADKDTASNELVPCVNGKKVSMDSIYLKDGANSQLIISSVNVKDPKKCVDTVVLLDNTGTLYMSTDAIYLYENAYEWDDDADYAESYTKISKFSCQDGHISAQAATKIRGTIDDVFQISQGQGVLRVLTTDWMGEQTHNRFYLLDDKLQELGVLKDFAPGEEIYAARYIGDIAYFVTYHNTDPLFAVDLSDPKNPVFLGQLEVSGFSDYLHPYGENELLGIGYETDPETSDRLGVKLVMFDLSDPKNLRIKDSVVLPGSDCAAANWYKAALVDSQKNLIGFGVADYNDSEHPDTYYVYSWNGKKFQKKLSQDLTECGDESQIRGLYAADSFYLVYPSIEDIRVIQYDLENDFSVREKLTLTEK